MSGVDADRIRAALQEAFSNSPSSGGGAQAFTREFNSDTPQDSATRLALKHLAPIPLSSLLPGYLQASTSDEEAFDVTLNRLKTAIEAFESMLKSVLMEEHGLHPALAHFFPESRATAARASLSEDRAQPLLSFADSIEASPTDAPKIQFLAEYLFSVLLQKLEYHTACYLTPGVLNQAAVAFYLLPLLGAPKNLLQGRYDFNAQSDLLESAGVYATLQTSVETFRQVYQSFFSDRGVISPSLLNHARVNMADAALVLRQQPDYESHCLADEVEKTFTGFCQGVISTPGGQPKMQLWQIQDHFGVVGVELKMVKPCEPETSSLPVPGRSGSPFSMSSLQTVALGETDLEISGLSVHPDAVPESSIVTEPAENLVRPPVLSSQRVQPCAKSWALLPAFAVTAVAAVCLFAIRSESHWAKEAPWKTTGVLLAAFMGTALISLGVILCCHCAARQKKDTFIGSLGGNALAVDRRFVAGAAQDFYQQHNRLPVVSAAANRLSVMRNHLTPIELPTERRPEYSHVALVVSGAPGGSRGPSQVSVSFDSHVRGLQ